MNLAVNKIPAKPVNRQAHLTDKQKIRKISKLIRYAEKRLRRRFGFLRHQNTLGMLIFFGSIAAMVGSAYLYVIDILPAWAVIIGNAFFASLLHELEHDLIHGMYFKDRWQEKLMMWGVWLFRGNTPSPFYRKKIHLLHHKESGQVTDIEEQMIGNGMKYGIKRFFVMLDQNLAFLLNARQVNKTAPALKIKEMVASAFPLQSLFTLLWNLFLGLMLFQLANHFWLQIELPAWATLPVNILTIAGVVYLVPNFIRQGALQFVSSNMHYFGDITPGAAGLLQQTQVLKPWYLLPFQLFCFNFGSTHGIHHFVVNQPFYLRQMITPIAHPAMIKYGVRYNDTGTFRRANRYHLAAA